MALNLETFSGLKLKETQQNDVILAQVISWVRVSEDLPENRSMRGRHNHLQYYRILPTMSMVTTPDGNQVLGQSYTNWLGEQRSD